MEHIGVSIFLQRYLLVPIVALWVYHLYQRKYHESGERKRQATLYLTLLLIGVWIAAFLMARYRVRDVFLVPVAVLAVAVAAAQRRSLFPFRLQCARCGKRLPLQRVLFHDANTCAECDPPKEPAKENTE